MLQPKGKHSTFNEYFELFWTIKFKSSCLRTTAAVCLVFDKEEREVSAKDVTRVRRDDKSESPCTNIDIRDNTLIPNNHSWTVFLANRDNNRRLVEYLI